jgi:plastocyanin
MLRLLCIGGACLALAMAGCGDDDEDTGAGGSGGEAAATQEAPAPETTAETETETESSSSEAGEEIKITMKGFAFDPQEVEGKVGQKVTWTNEDDAPHNAVAQNGGDLKTKTFEKGGSDSYTLDEPGTIEYICTIHPQMTGTIKVTE